MKNRFSHGVTVLASCVLAAHVHAAEGECGDVTIADMNWNSATLMANIDRFILEHGYGCNAELVPGDTMPTGTSMIEKGEPHVAPELWSANFPAAIEQGVKEGRLKVAGKSLSDGGEEGWWIPAYLVEEKPELATLEGIIANKDMFPHPEDPSVAGFMGCPAGWGCQITNTNLFAALDLESKGFELIDPGSGAALAGAIARAYERQQPWFGYYWAPTAVLGKYEMVKVDFGSGTDAEHFVSCISQADCADPRPTMYPPSPVDTIVTTELAEQSPQVFEYFTRRSFTNSEMNQYLAWMEDNQADGEIAMEHFLSTAEPIWTAWVPTDVADKVRSALADL